MGWTPPRFTRDMAPATDSCTCWPDSSGAPALPMRCGPCVAARVLLDLEDDLAETGGPLAGALADAVDRAAADGAEVLPEVVLEHLTRRVALDTPRLLGDVLDLRAGYARQVRVDLTGARPAVTVPSWGMGRAVEDATAAAAGAA